MKIKEEKSTSCDSGSHAFQPRRRMVAVKPRKVSRNASAPSPKQPDIRHVERIISSLPDSPTRVTCLSSYKGPIKEAIRKWTGARPLTVISGSSDWSVERNDVPGERFRKIFYEDKVITNKSSLKTERYTEREVVIPSTDIYCESPALLLEHYPCGRESGFAVARQLSFKGRISSDVVYVFEACGDRMFEDIDSGWRWVDLRIKFRVLPKEEWDLYITGRKLPHINSTCKYYGYDTSINLCINIDEITAPPATVDPYVHWRFKHQHDLDSIERERGIRNMVAEKNATWGITVPRKQLRDSLAGRFMALGNDVGDGGGGRGNREVEEGEEVVLLSLKLAGLGDRSEDGAGAGDLNVKIRTWE
ncbi:hypothetical protein AJ80_06168 [Polytolypa hystricis UAMH7299]|uniref:Uncharacterized protein n=1 Tax=Polytolypa hystricis (strain UAMH7299) TaxID=1447883 RepID=A0A2B7XY99_POLH7|nr:hypothetical protein AJ80_06168 [Polytolypa hystricis UAMH7299]